MEEPSSLIPEDRATYLKVALVVASALVLGAVAYLASDASRSALAELPTADAPRP